MDLIAISGLINGLSAIFFAIISIKYRNKNSLYIVFFWMNVVFAIWGWSYFFWLHSESYENARFWVATLSIGANFIPVLFFHWIVSYLNLNKKKIFVVSLGYFLATFFSFFVFSDFYVTSLEPVLDFKYWPVAGPLYIYFIILVYLGFSFYSIFILFIASSKNKGIERKKINFILIGTLIGVASGTSNFFLWYKIEIIPYLNFGVSIYMGILAYSMIRFRLMDIKLVLRKSSVYLLSFSAVLLFATGVKYLFSKFIPNIDLLDELFIIFVAIIAFPYIREYFSYISNKYFFASLYNSQEVITRFSERLSSTLEIEKLLESIATEVNKSFYPKSMAIFLYNEKDLKYYAAFSAGDSFEKRSSFDLSNNVINKYLEEKNILLMDNVKEKSEKDYKEIQETFLNKDIRLIVPLSIKDRYIGLFLMGEKESGETYNNEDIQLLQVLATQSSFALDNSLKFEEAKNFNILLEREVENAVMNLQKANAELRKLDTAKSDFISIASHQLRTPLTVIKGYISMILEGNFGTLPDSAREPTEKIYDSNERLIKLVEQLLSISRIESGRIKYNFEETDLSDLISSIMESIRYGAIKKGLNLSYSRPKGFTPLVNIDTSKMRQVISSLIDNSIKYTYKTEQKRGFILVRIEELQDKDRIRLIIEDNGMGIKEEDKVNLFKKFSRGKDISTVYTEGTGLGLYVAKQIIEAHGGFIYAESKGFNQGTKIYFDLPKVKREE